MLISCKCLNFIATSNSHQQHQQQQQLQLQQQQKSAAAVATADDCSAAAGSNLAAAMMHAFLLKYPRNFVFYSQFMDFLKQSIGPIPDLTINAVSQRDLIYSVTLDVAQPVTQQTWQFSICINCNSALCAKRLQMGASNPAEFLVNASLLTNNDELAHRRADKSFSEAFGLLIMDHPQLALGAQNGVQSPGGGAAASVAPVFNIGSMSSSSSTMGTLDAKQLRLRQLQQYLQQRLSREIAETDERVQRYTEQQFALLKSFREKSKQEFELLVQLLQRVPDQQATAAGGEWLDRVPPVFELNGAGSGSYAARRRNTIGSRRDMNSSTTPTTTPTTTPNPGVAQQPAFPVATAAASAIDAPFTQGQSVASSSSLNRKMSHFDTPPATPEAMPMSVGNSPTFRQQQQQQQQQQAPPPPFVRFTSSQSFQQQFPTPCVEEADDCLFDLEGVDGVGDYTPPQQQSHQFQSHSFQRQLHHNHHHQQQQQQQRPDDNSMSDQDESDGAEEAEDALNLDSSMPIPLRQAGIRRANNAAAAAAATAQMLNFGKSLPIEIGNSPIATRSYIDDTDDEEVDNNVDIAASIKALAKSVHGEAVFGDLPRPRLSSQI